MLKKNGDTRINSIVSVASIMAVKKADFHIKCKNRPAWWVKELHIFKPGFEILTFKVNRWNSGAKPFIYLIFYSSSSLLVKKKKLVNIYKLVLIVITPVRGVNPSLSAQDLTLCPTRLNKYSCIPTVSTIQLFLLNNCHPYNYFAPHFFVYTLVPSVRER